MMLRTPHRADANRLNPKKNFFEIPVLAEFCTDLLASETHFLQFDDREEQSSFVHQYLGECFPVVGLRDVFA